MKERFSPTERIGVNKVEEIFLSKFGWIPRTLHESDTGIDMLVEVVKDKEVTGEMIAVQIKSGVSYFNNGKDDIVVYRGKKEHSNYWLNYSLPVILVLHNPNTKITIWEEITNETVINTEKGFKINLSKDQELSIDFREELEGLNMYPEYIQRFQRLFQDKDMMEFVWEGGELILQLDEWVNKSSGRISIRIYKQTNKGDDLISEMGYYHFRDISDINFIFPWANFKIDEYYYSEHEDDQYYDGYFHNLEDPYEIRPIEDGSGEIHTYRLFFELNELGRSFIKVVDYINI